MSALLRESAVAVGGRVGCDRADRGRPRGRRAGASNPSDFSSSGVQPALNCCRVRGALEPLELVKFDALGDRISARLGQRPHRNDALLEERASALRDGVWIVLGQAYRCHSARSSRVECEARRTRSFGPATRRFRRSRTRGYRSNCRAPNPRTLVPGGVDRRDFQPERSRATGLLAGALPLLVGSASGARSGVLAGIGCSCCGRVGRRSVIASGHGPSARRRRRLGGSRASGCRATSVRGRRRVGEGPG